LGFFIFFWCGAKIKGFERKVHFESSMFSSLLFAIGVQGKAGNKMHSRITITTTFVKLLQAESRWMDTFCTKSVQ
jgi:hypothetical protein